MAAGRQAGSERLIHTHAWRTVAMPIMVENDENGARRYYAPQSNNRLEKDEATTTMRTVNDLVHFHVYASFLLPLLLPAESSWKRRKASQSSKDLLCFSKCVSEYTHTYIPPVYQRATHTHFNPQPTDRPTDRPTESHCKAG